MHDGKGLLTGSFHDLAMCNASGKIICTASSVDVMWCIPRVTEVFIVLLTLFIWI